VALSLEDTLALLCPSESETALLRACLHTGDSARSGWRRWLDGRNPDGTALCETLATWRTLLPLLARSARMNDLEIGRDVMSYLRATTAREELRAERYRPIAAMALAAIEETGARPLVLRGPALAATEYESWALRHCHDLDLLVAPDSCETANHALTHAGFVRLAGAVTARGDAHFEHTSGLQIAVHTHPFAIRYYDAPAGAFERNLRSITLGNRSVASPSLEATFVHGLGHATYSASRRNLRWVSDAWQIVSRHPELDWRDVLERIVTHRLELPVSTLVAYLARFGMPIPEAVVAELRGRALRGDRVAVDVALGGLAAGTAGDVLGIWRSARTWRGRMEIARWALAPTATYVRMTCNQPSSWLLPLCYAVRPGRFLAGRLVRRRAAPAGVA